MKALTLIRSILPAAVLASGIAQAQAPVPADAGYHLVVTEQASGARALVNGHYRAAERMSQLDRWARSTVTHAEGFLTACVAQIKQERLGSARRTCEAAVRAAMRAGPAASRRGSGIAAAIVARGVLRALNSDAAGSKRDFETALEHQPDMPAAVHNLALLEGDMAGRDVALAMVSN